MADQSESWGTEQEQRTKPKPKKIATYPEYLEALVAAPEGKEGAIEGRLAGENPISNWILRNIAQDRAKAVKRKSKARAKKDGRTGKGRKEMGEIVPSKVLHGHSRALPTTIHMKLLPDEMASFRKNEEQRRSELQDGRDRKPLTASVR